MKRFHRILTAAVALMLLAAACCAAQAESLSFKNVKQALQYIQDNQPEELTLENVKFKPSELLTLKNAMPEGAVFHFTTKWGAVTFSDDVEDLDLKSRKATITGEDLDAIVQICPGIKRIDNSNHSSPSNKVMIPLIEKYPEVQFEWKVSLGKGHYVSTTQTAYSTFNEIGSGKQLTAENLEVLKYCYRLQALDLGHNVIRNLDFLQYLPDLELLIIGQNYVKDLTPLGNLKHLQYAELFLNYYTDISPLANCTELLDLNMTATPITDLTPLDNITTLERLVVNMCRKLPQEQVDHFQELHPNCEVDYRISHSATNTYKPWRKHPRYKHYIWCLKHGTWIPFDQEIPSK